MKIWDVFLSHAREEKLILQPLLKILDSKFYVWYDDDQILTGENFKTVIELGLRLSVFGIVFFSANYFTKDWPQRELNDLVNKYSKKIFPIAYMISSKEIINKVPSLKEHKILEIKNSTELKSIKTMKEIVTAINFALRERDPVSYIIDCNEITYLMLDTINFEFEVISHSNSKVTKTSGVIWEKCIQFANYNNTILIKSCIYCYDSIHAAIEGYLNAYNKEKQNANEGRLLDPNVGEDKYGYYSIVEGGISVFRITNLLIRVEYYSPLGYINNFQESEKYARVIDKKIRLYISKKLLYSLKEENKPFH